MPNSGNQNSNTALTSYQRTLDLVTTTNATPVLLISVPVPSGKTANINVFIIARGPSTRNIGDTAGSFTNTSGTITQDGTLLKQLRGVLSTAQLTFTANNTTQAVEVYVNGLAATTINWSCELTVKYNT